MPHVEKSARQYIERAIVSTHNTLHHQHHHHREETAEYTCLHARRPSNPYSQSRTTTNNALSFIPDISRIRLSQKRTSTSSWRPEQEPPPISYIHAGGVFAGLVRTRLLIKRKGLHSHFLRSATAVAWDAMKISSTRLHHAPPLFMPTMLLSRTGVSSSVASPLATPLPFSATPPMIPRPPTYRQDPLICRITTQTRGLQYAGGSSPTSNLRTRPTR